MNDLFTDPKALALALLGVVMALLTWIGKGALDRLKHLEQNSASKADIDQRHEENIDRFDRLEKKIETGITGTHQRIDKLFDRLPERK